MRVFVHMFAALMLAQSLLADPMAAPTIRLAKQAERFEARLEAEGIDPTSKSLRAWFEKRAALCAAVEEMIEELASEDFSKRNAAAKRIADLPGAPRVLLEKAQSHPDFEIRIQCNKLLAFLKDKPSLDEMPDRPLARAMAWSVKEKKMSGVTDLLLSMAEVHGQLGIAQSLSDALTSSTSKNELRSLRDAAQRSSRLKATTKAARLLHGEKEGLPGKMTRGEQLLHALSRLNAGDRSALETLAEIAEPSEIAELDSTGDPVTARAYRLADSILSDIANEATPNASGDWREWVQQQGDNIKLAGPYRIDDETFDSFIERVVCYSTGFSDGNSAHIAIDGEVVVGDLKSKCPSRRGINVVAMQDDEILLYGNYDTFASREESDEFAEDINGLPDDCFLVLAAADEPSSALTQHAREALKEWGIDKAPRRHRSSWYALGQKGLKEGQAIVEINEQGRPIFYPPQAEKTLKVTKMPIEEERDQPRLLFKDGELNKRDGLSRRFR